MILIIHYRRVSRDIKDRKNIEIRFRKSDNILKNRISRFHTVSQRGAHIVTIREGS